MKYLYDQANYLRTFALVNEDSVLETIKSLKQQLNTLNSRIDEYEAKKLRKQADPCESYSDVVKRDLSNSFVVVNHSSKFDYNKVDLFRILESDTKEQMDFIDGPSNTEPNPSVSNINNYAHASSTENTSNVANIISSDYELESGSISF